MILISKYLVPKGYMGMTIFPFVFLKHEQLRGDKVLINHEKLHLRQQIELMIIPFYLFYSLEFFWRLAQYKNWHLAYRNISFEREAYANEKDSGYLNKRPLWAFLGYLRSNGFQTRK